MTFLATAALFFRIIWILALALFVYNTIERCWKLKRVEYDNPVRVLALVVAVMSLEGTALALAGGALAALLRQAVRLIMAGAAVIIILAALRTWVNRALDGRRTNARRDPGI